MKITDERLAVMSLRPDGIFPPSPEEWRAMAHELLVLRKDKARLDWLHNKGTIEIECSFDDTYSIGEQIDNEEYPTLRDAIDAATKFSING